MLPACTSLHLRVTDHQRASVPRCTSPLHLSQAGAAQLAALLEHFELHGLPLPKLIRQAS